MPTSTNDNEEVVHQKAMKLLADAVGANPDISLLMRRWNADEDLRLTVGLAVDLLNMTEEQLNGIFRVNGTPVMEEVRMKTPTASLQDVKCGLVTALLLNLNYMGYEA